jgi:peptidoglycan/LPS O-acetylase OafA/YrhL
MAVLDGVRGLAILMVLFVHFVGNEEPYDAVERLMRKVANYGVWGVDLFFVLSGFLITGILWDTKEGPRYFKNFYIRRTLRIFPLYYGVLAFLFVLLPLVPALYPQALTESARHQAWLWPYGTNVYVGLKGTWALPYVTHFWSLAIEEHFYLVWPLVVFVCSRTTLLRVCVATSAFSLVLRCIMAFLGANDITLQVLTPCRLDALCVGAFIAVASRPDGLGALGRKARPALIATGSAILLLSAWHHSMQTLDEITEPLRGTCIALFFGALIVRSVTAEPSTLVARFFGSRAMRFLGKYSYGLYVYHGILAFGLEQYPVNEWLTARVGAHKLAMVIQAIAGGAVSVGVSVLSYEAFEKHFLVLKDRFAPSKRRA